MRNLIYISFIVLFLCWCSSDNGTKDIETDREVDTDSDTFEYYCDPDSLDCPMVCVEDTFGNGKVCREKDNLPDDSHWQCEDQQREDGTWVRVCKKRGSYSDEGYSEGWECEQQGEFVVCEKEISGENGDYLDDAGEGYYDCWTEGEFVICDYHAPDEWECYDDEDGNRICILREPDYPNDEDDWECYQFEGADGQWWTVCETENGSGRAEGGWECVELPNGHTRCQRSGRDYPEDEGSDEMNCYYDEFGDLICEYPGGEGEECVPGQRRWCDGPTYCRWGWQECLPDGTWERECHEFTQGEDRPNNPCGCRHVLFTPICCERPDCIIPEDHTPPDCTGDGELCSWCVNDEDCGGENDRCIYELTTSRVSYCGRDCSQNQSCPENYICMPMTNDASVMQCVPELGGEVCDLLWTPPQSNND